MRLGDLNILLSFGAGILSFISPCCLPLYPAFLSYITGLSISELKEDNKKLNRKPMLHTLFFLIGFSIIFVILGLSTSVIYDLFYEYIDLIRLVGAILIIIFGLMIVGVLDFLHWSRIRCHRNPWFIDWTRFIIYDCLYSWVFHTFLNNVIFYREIRMDKKI